MATTATQKQSAAIRDQMQLVRNRLPYSMDEARTTVQQMTDWKYHTARHPWVIFGMVAVVAYMAVPRTAPAPQPASSSGVEDPGKTVAKASVLSMLLSAVTTFALKTGTGLLAQRLSQAMEARGGGRGRPPY